MLFVVSAVLFDMLKARQLACVSKSGQKCPAASLSSWRAWIEIRMPCRRPRGGAGSPHGERGLKYHPDHEPNPTNRSPHGERGLKSWLGYGKLLKVGSPHGERGLKFLRIVGLRVKKWSLSSWRAWIEIRRRASSRTPRKSLSSWRAWIEIDTCDTGHRYQ